MWYNRVVDNLGEIPTAIDFYNQELLSAQDETRIRGNVEKNAQELSGVMSYRFDQLQEIEAILKFLNIKYDKMRSDHYRKYLERYQRDLSDRSIEKYIDGEDDIVGMAMIINEVSLVRNRYLALIKGLDVKQFQISNIVRLRIVGMEDAHLGTKGYKSYHI
jgi:hypothetical protein